MDTRQFWEHTMSVAIGISLGYCIIKTGEHIGDKLKTLINSPKTVTEDRLTRLEKLLLQKAEDVCANK